MWSIAAGAQLDQVLAHKASSSGNWIIAVRQTRHAFEKVLYHTWRARAQRSERRHTVLITQGFVDPARIGLYGWSYGAT